MANVLQEFLVSIGFQVNQGSQQQATSSLNAFAAQANALGQAAARAAQQVSGALNAFATQAQALGQTTNNAFAAQAQALGQAAATAAQQTAAPLNALAAQAQAFGQAASAAAGRTTGALARTGQAGPSSLGRLTQATQVASSGFRGMQLVVAGATGAIAGHLSAMARDSIGSFRTMADGMEQIYFASQRLGASGENIRAFGFAAANLGSSTGAAQTSLENFNRLIQSTTVAGGRSGVLDIVERLGVRTRDLRGNVRDASAMMQDLGRALSTMEPARRIAYAQLFGIDFRTLRALIEGTGQFSATYHAMAQQIGVDSTRADLAAHQVGTSFRTLGAAFDLLWQKAVQTFGPTLARNIAGFTQFLMNHSDQIVRAMEFAGRAFLGVSEAVVQLAYRAGQAAADIGRWWSHLSGSTKFVIEALGGLAIAWRLLNSAFLTSPIGIILSLGAGFLLLYDDYRTWREGGAHVIDWDRWAPEIENAVNGLKRVGAVLYETGAAVDDFTRRTGVQSAVGELIGPAWQRDLERLKRDVQTNNPFDALATGAGAVVRVVTGHFDTILQTMERLRGFFRQVGTDLASGEYAKAFTDWWTFAAGEVGQRLRGIVSLWSNLAAALDRIPVLQGVKAAFDSVLATVQEWGEAIVRVFSSIVERVRTVWHNVTQAGDSFRLPDFAGLANSAIAAIEQLWNREKEIFRNTAFPDFGAWVDGAKAKLTELVQAAEALPGRIGRALLGVVGIRSAQAAETTGQQTEVAPATAARAGGISDAVAGWLEQINRFGNDASAAIAGAFSTAFAGVTEAANAAWTNIENAFSGVRDRLIQAWNTAIAHLTAITREFSDWLTGGFVAAFNAAENAGKAVGDAVWAALNRAYDLAKEIAGWWQDHMPRWLGGTAGPDPADMTGQAGVFGRLGQMLGMGGGGAPAGQTGPLPTEELRRRERESFEFWTGKGFTPAGAAGMVAQERAESGFDWTRVGDNGQARGAFQWHPDRRARIQQATDIDVANPNTTHLQQLTAMYEEMSRGLDRQSGEAFDRIKRASDPRAAAALGVTLVERPRDTFGNVRARGETAADTLRRQATDAAKVVPVQPQISMQAPEWLPKLVDRQGQYAMPDGQPNPWAAMANLAPHSGNVPALQGLQDRTYIVPPTAPTVSQPINNAGDRNVNQTNHTTINVTGSGDPSATARLVERDQQRLYPDLLRNLQGAVQ